MAGLRETADYFGISFQGLADYVKKHLDEINSDGEHAIIHRGKWNFDRVAIERLEKMRGFIAENGSEIPLGKNPATVEELRRTVASLSAKISELESKNDGKKISLDDVLDKDGNSLRKIFSQIAERLDEIRSRIGELESEKEKKTTNSPTVYFWLLLVLMSAQFLYFFLR